MAQKFFFLYLDTQDRPVPNSPIEQALNSFDWVRLRGGRFYLVYSKGPAKKIRDAVQPLLNHEDHLLVGEFNKSDHSGWISKLVIDWLQKDRPVA